MLNQLMETKHVGFAWAVRDSIFVLLGLLVAANLLMTSKPMVTRKAAPPSIKTFLTDKPFVLGTLGYALSRSVTPRLKQLMLP